MKLHKKIEYLCEYLMLILLLSSCERIGIEGVWLTKIPGLDVKQGFALKSGGVVSSINMFTLCYDSWKFDGKHLILSGTKMEDCQELLAIDTLFVNKLTRDSLIVSKGSNILQYKKVEEFISSLEKKSLVTGTLRIGHEVRAFKADDSNVDYWIVDKTGGVLMQKYDSITGGIKNCKPVQVQMEVVDMGKSDNGFAQDYFGVYYVTEVKSISLLK